MVPKGGNGEVVEPLRLHLGEKTMHLHGALWIKYDDMHVWNVIVKPGIL